MAIGSGMRCPSANAAVFLVLADEATEEVAEPCGEQHVDGNGAQRGQNGVAPASICEGGHAASGESTRGAALTRVFGQRQSWYRGESGNVRMSTVASIRQNPLLTEGTCDGFR